MNMAMLIRSRERRRRPVYIRHGVFPFLDLPAEIRNSIYEYTITELATEDYYEIGPNSMKFRFTRRHKARLRLQLTQVCRQIRMEFRGLYFVKVPKWVDLWNFDAYIAAFHVDNVPAPDNVTVDMLGLASKHARTYDFLPILKVLSGLPHRVCNFDHSICRGQGASLVGLGPILTRCATRVRTSEWKATARMLLSITVHWENKKVVVRVKWAYTLTKGKARKSFEKQLLSDLGLRREGRWGVLVK